jgi:hypothetical protein
MAIGRISGSVLKSNLTRNGVDLAFETNLLYLDVTNSRVGIGTSEPSTALHVVGNTTITGNLYLSGSFSPDTISVNNLYSTDSTAIQINDAVNISGALSSSGIKYPITDGTNGQFIKTDGAGNLTFGTVSTNSISQLNSNVTVTDAGTGSITIVADGTTVATFNTATGVDASTSTKSLRLPNGATGDRPTGAAGMIRYNSTSDTIEGYTTAGGWAQLGATTAAAQDTTNTSVNAYTAISTTQVTADSFLTGAFDSAWYLAVTKDEINTEMSTAKYSLVQNKTSAYVSTSSLTSSGTNKQIAIDADVSGGNVRLRATGTSVVNSVSFYRIGLGDNTTAATSGNASTIINATVTSSSSNIDTWSKLSYRGAKYFISAKNSTTGEYSNMECMITHYNNTPYIQVYNNVNTGNNDLLTLDASISGNNVQLTASANQPNCRVILYRILLSDAETAAAGTNTNVIGATTVSSSDTTVDSFLTSSYTGCHYVVVAVNSTEGAASIQEVTVVSDGADAYVTTGPIVSSKSSDQLQFSASLSGTTATLKASSTSGSSTTINAYRVQLYRPSAGASTADTVLVSTTQTISGQKTFTAPIALTVGSDPSTVANTAHIYAKSAASSAEVYVRDEAGNVTKISPHNEQGEWEYYSRNTKTGKTVRINMEEMIRDIEKITGKNYIKTTN